MRTSVVLLTLLVAGCGFLSRAKNTFYSLETIPFAGQPATIGGTPVGIDGIELPPGVDRREVVVRGAGQQLEVRGTNIWAGPLEEMVIHTLAFNLAKRLPEGMVILPGQAKPAAMRPIYITFEDLTAGPDNVFTLDARWTMGATVRHETVTVPMSSLDSASVAAAMSTALTTLAERVVAQLVNR